jgi:hypothetical protein
MIGKAANGEEALRIVEEQAPRVMLNRPRRREDWHAGRIRNVHAPSSPYSRCNLRPVTPEVAGSIPVGPANLKHSCAATSRCLFFAAARSAKRPAQGSAQGACFQVAQNTPNNGANHECSTRTRPLFHGPKASGEQRKVRAGVSAGGTTATWDAHSSARRDGDYSASGAAALRRGVARREGAQPVSANASGSTHAMPTYTRGAAAGPQYTTFASSHASNTLPVCCGQRVTSALSSTTLYRCLPVPQAVLRRLVE